MHPFYHTQDVTLYCADNIILANELEGESVHLTVTSPPYDTLRDYAKDVDSWSFERFQVLARELYRITVSGGVVVWNVSDQTSNGSETGSSFRQALFFMECGFNLADTMIYKKANPGGARGSNKTYIQCFEYMFIFSKGSLRVSNLLKDRPNKRQGLQTGGGKRQKDGSLGQTSVYHSEDFGRRFNIWEYPTQTDRSSGQHPAPFPYALARDHILSWSNPGDLVFDPFAGSGTTLAAAMETGRRAIGTEIAQAYCDIARARLETLRADLDRLALFGVH